MSDRKSEVTRKTSETDISLALNVDGTGKHDVQTDIPFLTHMIEQFSKHGLFDLTVKASGDTDIDNHHLNEDLALVLGEAFQKALEDKKGMRRFGFFYAPMDDTLVRVVLDFCNRPFYIVNGLKTDGEKREDYYFQDLDHFFRSFAQSAGLNLQLDIIRGSDKHHIIEASFKALAKAADMATQIDPRVEGIPSTKGII